MAFTSFEPFLYARNDLRFVVLDEVSAKKSGKYYIYELYSKNSAQNSPTKNERNLGENSQNLPQNEQISQKNSPQNAQTKPNSSQNSHPNPQNSEVKKEKFTYTALNNELFAPNDELVITILGRKIILFRNFTRLTDNFKEARLRHTIFSLLFFCASAVFGAFCVKNGFLVVDMAFFMLFLLGFIISLINYALLKRQIAILSTLEKQDFIDYTKG